MNSIFISYSRKDQDEGERLYSNLRLQDLDAKIDVQDIPIGEDIKSTIDDLIARTDCSLVLLSENSLQSAWVFWEIQRRRSMGNFSNHSKIIPVYIDKAYLDDGYVGHLLSDIDTKIDQVINEAKYLNSQRTSTIHLDNKKQRLYDFKNGFGTVIDYIRSINAADLTKENYLFGFKSLYKAITGEENLRNDKIVTPSQYKNTNESARADEIAFLVAEDNIKDAIKRTIDFVKEFYPNDRTMFLKAITISQKLNAGEKNLDKGLGLISFNQDLVSEILNLIYPPKQAA